VRRRRKTKYTWLPGDNNPITAGDETINPVPFTINGTITTDLVAGVNRSALPVLVVTNVLADFPETDIDAATVSLADEIGSEYFIKRIVGKCFVAVNHEAAANAQALNKGNKTVLVTCGIFIAPADPANIGSPLGNSEDIYQRENPQGLQSIRQPWIWRRSWMLNPFGLDNSVGTIVIGGIPIQESNVINNPTTGGVNGLGTFPPNNALYGSVMDGPHVDAKTARRVRLHERLWVAAAAMTMPEQTIMDPAQTKNINFNVTWDLRVLGALRRAHNRSNFA